MLWKSFLQLEFSWLLIGHYWPEFFCGPGGLEGSLPERLNPLFFNWALAVEVWHVVRRRGDIGLFRGCIKNESKPIWRHLKCCPHRWWQRWCWLNINNFFWSHYNVGWCRWPSSKSSWRSNDPNTSRWIPWPQWWWRIWWRWWRCCVDILRQQRRIWNSLETLELSCWHRANIFPGFGPKFFRHQFWIQGAGRWNLPGLWDWLLPPWARLSLFFGHDLSWSWNRLWNFKISAVVLPNVNHIRKERGKWDIISANKHTLLTTL